MAHEDWRKELASMTALRMSEVASFLRQCGRSQVCPFCNYSGEWDFHIQWPGGADEPEVDPLMTVFNMSSATAEAHQCVAITCSNCAHFSMLDVNRIKMHILKRSRAQEQNHG